MGLMLSYKNWCDAPDTVLTPSSEITSMKAVNIVNPLSYLVWRTLIAAGTYTSSVSFDFGSAQTIQVLAAQFPRSVSPDLYNPPVYFAQTDSVRFTLSNSSLTGTDVLDTGYLHQGSTYSGGTIGGVLPNFGTFACWLNAAKSAQYMTVYFQAPSRVTAGFLDVKRVWAGPVIAPTIGFQYGINHSWETAGKVLSPLRGNTTFPAFVDAKRKWSFTLGFVDNATERDLLEDFEAYITTTGESLIHRSDLSAGRGDMFCYQAQVSGLTQNNWNKSAKSFLVSENI